MRIGRLFKPKPDVGIVMPVYFQEPSYLRIALRSILEQSYKSFDFVIVVDGAPSETIQVIREETDGDERVEIIIKKENQGVSKALNTGFERLLKRKWIKYLTWVSSDNIYYPNFIEELHKALRQGPPDLGLVYSSFRHVDPDGNPKQSEEYLVAFRKFQEQPKERLIDVCFIGISFMYKKEYAALIDGYRLEPVEDFEYWLRLTEHCDIQYVPMELMDYRENAPHSISLKIHSSPTLHRRWRYAFNLARQQSRDRHGISFETTVIFPVWDGSDETVAKLDELLEQFYHNYKLWVIDVSPDTVALPVLKQIEDPRMTFMALPSNENTAVQYMLQRIDTPFTLIYGKGFFPPAQDAFYNLVLRHHQLSKQGVTDVISTFYQSPSGPVSYRTTVAPNESVLFELYRTKILMEIFNMKR